MNTQFFAKAAQIVAILGVKAIFSIRLPNFSELRLVFEKVTFFLQLASVCQLCRATAMSYGIGENHKS